MDNMLQSHIENARIANLQLCETTLDTLLLLIEQGDIAKDRYRLTVNKLRDDIRKFS